MRPYYKGIVCITEPMTEFKGDGLYWFFSMYFIKKFTAAYRVFMVNIC